MIDTLQLAAPTCLGTPRTPHSTLRSSWAGRTRAAGERCVIWRCVQRKGTMSATPWEGTGLSVGRVPPVTQAWPIWSPQPHSDQRQARLHWGEWEKNAPPRPGLLNWRHCHTCAFPSIRLRAKCPARN